MSQSSLSELFLFVTRLLMVDVVLISPISTLSNIEYEANRGAGE